MPYTCDGCGQEHQGSRVVFTTEATDDRGVDVVVAKRWIVCPSCGEDVFARIGRPSPWAEGDVRTLAFPDSDTLDAVSGGFARSL
jgi:predicted RNA-binding Zn-ribbon protein involved in translation (DUF1610 family)